MGSVLLVVALISGRAAAAEGDPHRFYAAFGLPLVGVGSNGSQTILQFDLTPFAVEYGIAPRLGLRGTPMVGYELTLESAGTKSGITTVGGRLELPYYFEAIASEERMVGAYSGPYVWGASTYGAATFAAGGSGGYSVPLGSSARLRLGGHVGAGYTPSDTTPLSLDLGLDFEFGALLF